MQYKNFRSKNTERLSQLSFWIRLAIFLAAGAFMYYFVSKRPGIDKDFLESIITALENRWPFLLLALVLFPFNWAMEAVKWKLLIDKIEHLNFLKAFRGVLTGLTFGFLTPHGLGDYAGRLLHLSVNDRSRGIGAVFMSRIAQFYITLYFGSIALVFFINELMGSADRMLKWMIIFFIICTNLIFIFIFLYHKRILLYLQRVNLFSRIYKYFEILQMYSMREVIRVLIISMFRYLIFSVQFLLLLLFFEAGNDVALFITGIAFIFLAKSVVPTFFDFGVREASALYFFGHFYFEDEKIIFASLSLWIINILLPALIGMAMIFKLKITPRT